MYPLTLLNELEVLKEKGIEAPKIVYHPMVRITTPWDILMNRLDEDNLAHGTCGLGIGKTMERSEGMYQLRMCDTFDSTVFMHKLEAIRKEYTQFIPESYLADLEREVEKFVKAFESISWHISNYGYLNNFKNIVFEGSQGVMLDMDHGVFPNVTYSNTTSKNAMEVCDKLEIVNRHLWGVTRAYSTRHGKGDGEYTGEPVSLSHTEHETNVNNRYQGEFLATKMDYKRLTYACLIEDIYSEAKVVNHLMVTCCNQVKGEDVFDFNKINYQFDKVYFCYDTHHKEIETML